uniref:Oxysterol-binding protein n=1 Tax=Chlamydomonas leiostraca TaxID=1034604 RepID=A0A7S0RQA2_9CHLO|mmetsp:Transcript_28861/g.73640  ORF Transcript_28861/g.73640 Transcript_28861/m.73640 type:complete len:459 (+) Transcript_28861:160-1536(+)|eukprot:CAMPEP_0202868062 /NCGR_PEP_ID=MMETSP1391-20130828/10115_1 /ASSEMBLY_ACC=CAM_ASM_000867 /TAXON_ID=1034604 /ORGANISM="Chlamydomonas leiostraca, Strain SAG 11-49" /LENGTH=458 /DNA_ID=CAMNT_0049548167 /DNA_START=154 /DNA_END=1530 /DNA_ORIENTATION=-
MAAQQNASGGGMLSGLYNWGGSVMQYATEQLNNFLGWEDLEVVDPEAEKSEKGAAKAEGHHQAERKQVWGTKQFQQYIGMDVTSLLSVPVWIMEPFTILQKAAEIMEYTELLDKADQCSDPHERFAFLAAYCVSPFGAAERAWKPFNPILGETFELEIGNGVRYLAEQVSHHPPVCAAHAENAHFMYDLVSAPTTKFLGNSLEVYPYGRTRITLRKSGEVYTLVPPNAMVHNIVIGRTWVDAFGPMNINCAATGAKCVLEFTPCGWFSYGRYEFTGYVTDKDGKKHIKLTGKWNEYCDMVKCDAEGNVPADATPTRLWTCNEKPKNDYYSFTNFAHKLNSSDGIRVPLPSDSRRRPDRAALAAGETSAAGSEKYRLEEMQRAEKRERDGKGDKWTPRWFDAIEAPALLPGELPLDKVPFWQFNGKYLQEAERPTGATKDAVDGKGFCPWQYPTIHEKL